MLVFARHQNIERIRSTAGTKDSCFFIQRDNATWKPNLMISVLVDDLLIMGISRNWCWLFIRNSRERIKCLNLRRSRYNGIIYHGQGNTSMHVQEYTISQFLANVHHDVNPCGCLVPWIYFCAGDARRGRLMYCPWAPGVPTVTWITELVWYCTRPDLAFTCSLAGRVASNSTQLQLKQLRRVIGYLKRNPKKELVNDGSKCNG